MPKLRKTFDKADHFVRFDGWRDVTAGDEVPGSGRIATFILAKNGLGGFAGTRMSYKKEDIRGFLDPIKRGEHGHTFSDRDFRLLRHARRTCPLTPQEEAAVIEALPDLMQEIGRWARLGERIAESEAAAMARDADPVPSGRS